MYSRLISITVLMLTVLHGFGACGQDGAPGVQRVLIICGHPGDEAHHTLFAATVTNLHRGLVENLGVAPERINLQFGESPTPDDSAVISSAGGQSTREEISAAVKRIEGEIQPEDSLWVIVMGHAYFDGRNAFLNLPGPDLRADEFGKLFTSITCQEQVFFLTCPVSGFFIKPLAAPFRVVMSATEADQEINETESAIALADILTTPPHRAAFDVDQDGQLTLFDLYIVHVRRVVERYTAVTAVVTEHGLLEDNGDGRGSEVQIDYLTEEQGGRWKPGDPPAKSRKDGIFSKRVLLQIQVPERDPEAPADALLPENESQVTSASPEAKITQIEKNPG